VARHDSMGCQVCDVQLLHFQIHGGWRVSSRCQHMKLCWHN